MRAVSVSGYKHTRPQFSQLIRAAARPEYNYLLFYPGFSAGPGYFWPVLWHARGRCLPWKNPESEIFGQVSQMFRDSFCRVGFLRDFLQNLKSRESREPFLQEKFEKL
jgi:hypothetical protein